MGTKTLRGVLLGVAIIVGGCSASTSSPTAAPGGGAPGGGAPGGGAPAASATTGAGGGGGGGGAGTAAGFLYSGQVNFTGGTPVQGTFTDKTNNTMGESCSDFATTGMPFQAGWFGPNPEGSVGGQTVSVSPSVPYKDFHGPGTYTKNYFIALKIGDNLYATDSVTIVVNGDDSGSLTFADAVSGAGVAPEAGTMTWTCTNI